MLFPVIYWGVILLILLVIIIGIIVTSFCGCIENLTKRNLFSVWIVEKDRKIYGFISCAQRGNFRMIGRLVVALDRQNMGIGSALVRHCINSVETPIYLVCNPRLKNYYYRFGFIAADLSTIPPELSPQKTNYTLMVLDS